MKIKIKDMQNTNLDCCLEKKYYCEKYSYDKYSGIISLTLFNNVSNPLIVE